MHKIIVGTIIFMGSVYGMDGIADTQKQRHQKTNLKELSQDSLTQFSRTPDDLFPIIESYRAAKQHQHQQQELLQGKLNKATSLQNVITLGKSDEAYKLSPLHLDLEKYYKNVNDAAIKELADLFSNLEILTVARAPITDVGLSYIKNLTQLTSLNLGINEKITDAGLVHLKGLTNLTKLLLGYTLTTDAGMVHLKGLTNLTKLLLGHTLVTDAGLVHLEGLTNLKELPLRYLPISAGGIYKLRKALPNCDIKF